MARLPAITDRNEVPEEGRFAFDYLQETRGAVRGPFAVVLHHPEVAQRVAHVGTFVRFNSMLSPLVRELAGATTSSELDSMLEKAGHLRQAKENGASEAALAIVDKKADIAGLSEDEALPIRAARELMRNHKLADATYAAAVKAYGEKGTIELLCNIGYFSCLAAIFNGLDIEPTP